MQIKNNQTRIQKIAITQKDVQELLFVRWLLICKHLRRFDSILMWLYEFYMFYKKSKCIMYLLLCIN